MTDDPAWLRVFWPVWLSAVVGGFVFAETWALVSRGRGGTLTERVKAWIGIDPPNPRRRWAATGLGVAIALLAVWLIPHFTHWPGRWPWER